MFSDGVVSGSGRRLDAQEHVNLRSCAAISMQFLMWSGMTTKDAASYVARKLNNSGWKKRGTDPTITWLTVSKWRERVGNPSTRGELDAFIYQSLKAMHDVPATRDAHDLKQRVDNLLQALGERYPQAAVAGILPELFETAFNVAGIGNIWCIVSDAG